MCNQDTQLEVIRSEVKAVRQVNATAKNEPCLATGRRIQTSLIYMFSVSTKRKCPYEQLR